MALLSGIGALFGGIGNTTGARTGTNAYTTGTTTGNSSSGGSSTLFNPYQTGVQSSESSLLKNILQPGGINTSGMLQSGTDAINESAQGAGTRLTQSLAARGFGPSGMQGSAALQTELGRQGQIGGLQNSLNQYAMQQQLGALGSATGFGFAAPSYSTFGSSAGATNTSGNSAYTVPGSSAAGALGGGLNGLLNGMNQIIAGGSY